MSKTNNIIRTVMGRANSVANTCVRLYNEERVVMNVDIAITLEELKVRRLTSGTKVNVLDLLRRKGFEGTRYDAVTKTFRGHLSFPNIVFESSNLPLKPVTLRTPLLRTAMGDVYRRQA